MVSIVPAAMKPRVRKLRPFSSAVTSLFLSSRSTNSVPPLDPLLSLVRFAGWTDMLSTEYYADGDCDPSNNNAECGYDWGDCCSCTCVVRLELKPHKLYFEACSGRDVRT